MEWDEESSSTITTYVLRTGSELYAPPYAPAPCFYVPCTHYYTPALCWVAILNPTHSGSKVLFRSARFQQNAESIKIAEWNLRLVRSRTRRPRPKKNCRARKLLPESTVPIGPQSTLADVAELGSPLHAARSFPIVLDALGSVAAGGVSFGLSLLVAQVSEGFSSETGRRRRSGVRG